MSVYFTSDYLNAERASAEHRDTRTRDQRKWDDLEYSIAENARKVRTLTQDQIGWARKPKMIEIVRKLVADLDRELSALAIIGYRDGDPVGGIPKLEPITDRIIPLTMLDVSKGDAA